MLNIRKVLFLGTLSIIVPSTLFLSSCTQTKKEKTHNLIKDEKPFEKYYGAKVAAKLSSDPTTVQRKTILITAGALVNDKSFNQETWDALQVYRRQAKIYDNETITYRETTNDNNLSTMYNYALKNNYKTWFLTGFQHIAAFGQWLKTGNNLESFQNSKAVIVGIDWDGSEFIPAGQFFGIGFKSQEAAWVVGHAASEYLATSNKKPHLSTFGGAIFNGVTEFNSGFLQGMLDWNKANPTQKVKFYSGNNEVQTIDLTTGFDPSASGVVEKINNLVGLGEDAPQIILPVAGGLVATALDNIKNKKSSQMLIGTDSNQSLVFPQDKNIFFSSIEKKVSLAVYKSLIMLAKIPLDYTTPNATDIGFKKQFIENKSNAFIKYGFDRGFVGYSPSSMEESEAVKANECLERAFKKFSSTPIIFANMDNPLENEEKLNKLIEEINL